MQFAKTNRRVNGYLIILGLLGLCCSMAAIAQAQSSEISAPWPLRTNEVTGAIRARDIGDPRLTDHFYAFTGTPGEVLITIDSRNLNGDIDVFTTSGLRPLLKITVYSSNSAPISKSIYLRKREDLILRVEGRTPNDDDGTYKVSFSGSFEPVTGGLWPVETAAASVEEAATTSAKRGHRVSAVGARINEPPPAEVAAAPTPEPSPAEAAETPVTTKAKTVDSPAAPKGTPTGSARTRRGATRRTRNPPAPKAEGPAANTETAAIPSVEEPRSAPAPEVRKPAKSRGTGRRKPPEEPPAEALTPAESGPRLIIEVNDGTLINRYMSSVRRVTVEAGQIVVVGKDGKTERIVLASVLRMTIAP